MLMWAPKVFEKVVKAFAKRVEVPANSENHGVVSRAEPYTLMLLARSVSSEINTIDGGGASAGGAGASRVGSAQTGSCGRRSPTVSGRTRKRSDTVRPPTAASDTRSSNQ